MYFEKIKINNINQQEIIRHSLQSPSRGTKGFCTQLKKSEKAKSFFFYPQSVIRVYNKLHNPFGVNILTSNAKSPSREGCPYASITTADKAEAWL